MSSEPITSAEYIHHHLQNLTFGNLPEGGWGVAHSAAEAKAMGFWALNIDTLGVSLLLGALFLLLFSRAARYATEGVPAGLQNFVEWIIEFIDGSVRGSFTGQQQHGCASGADHLHLDLPDESDGPAAD